MKTFKKFLDERCWTGHKPVPGKKPYSPGSCKKEDVEIEEASSPAQQAAIAINKKMEKLGKLPKQPKGEYERKVDKYLKKKYAKEEVEQIDELTGKGKLSQIADYHRQKSGEAKDKMEKIRSSNRKLPVPFELTAKISAKDNETKYHSSQEKRAKALMGKDVMSNIFRKVKKEEVEELFDIVEDMVTEIAQLNNVDPEVIWEDFETIPDEELYEVAAWQRKEGKSESGGLNRKGIASYRRENPGSKLSMAVTTKPSKLKAGSKAANRRKSFCARMSGMKRRLTSAKTARDPNSRINKSLRKWNC